MKEALLQLLFAVKTLKLCHVLWLIRIIIFYKFILLGIITSPNVVFCPEGSECDFRKTFF